MPKYEPKEREWVDCAYIACNHRAILRTYKGNSYSNLCQDHYDTDKQIVADKWNQEKGLLDIAQRKEYFFKHPFKIKKMP